MSVCVCACVYAALSRRPGICLGQRRNEAYWRPRTAPSSTQIVLVCDAIKLTGTLHHRFFCLLFILYLKATVALLMHQTKDTVFGFLT